MWLRLSLPTLFSPLWIHSMMRLSNKMASHGWWEKTDNRNGTIGNMLEPMAAYRPKIRGNYTCLVKIKVCLTPLWIISCACSQNDCVFLRFAWYNWDLNFGYFHWPLNGKFPLEGLRDIIFWRQRLFSCMHVLGISLLLSWRSTPPGTSVVWSQIHR